MHEIAMTSILYGFIFNNISRITAFGSLIIKNSKRPGAVIVHTFKQTAVAQKALELQYSTWYCHTPCKISFLVVLIMEVD